jgi:hypothetical protein
MKINELRGYGVASSDAEADWPKEIKQKLKRESTKVVLSNLTFTQKIKFAIYFSKEKKRSKTIDLTTIHKRGMTNKVFINQQLEYLSLYSALKITVGTDKAKEIAFKIMDATAAEAMLYSLPTPEDIRKVGEPFDVCKELFTIMPETAAKAGCHEIITYDDHNKTIGFDIHWCVWLELAKLMDVPEACIPNCYADELAYPKYFAELGLKYKRTGTLANGGNLCDFRFEKMGNAFKIVKKLNLINM